MLNDPIIDSNDSRTRHPRGLATWMLIATSVSLAACGADVPAGSAFVVHDSAGVEVVENTAALWTAGDAWSIDAEPVLEIGTIDGADAYQLDGVTGVVRLDDGRIVVADGGSRRIRFYDGSGRHIADAGGQGGGPGEFEALSGIVLMPGDSVAGWDRGAKRLTVFDAEGRLARTVTFADVGGFDASLRGAFGDGSLVIVPGEDMLELMDREPGEYRRTVVYLRFSGDGALIDTLTVAPGIERVAYREGTSFGNRSVLFGRTHHLVLAGDRYYEGDNDAFTVTVGAPDGVVLRSVRRLSDPRPVTRSELAEAVQREVESVAASERAFAERMGTSISEADPADFAHRETYPAFDRLIVDTENNLWVRTYPVPGIEAQTWSIFDPEGRWLGEVETPDGLEVYQIGSDYLLGRWEDEFDVQYVRVHSLARP